VDVEKIEDAVEIEDSDIMYVGRMLFDVVLTTFWAMNILIDTVADVDVKTL